MTLFDVGEPVAETVGTAVLSADETYRYVLTRRWAEGPKLLWMMLNPSTADAMTDDRTISQCIHFTRAHGFDGLTVVNLYALRATNPDELDGHPDPVGPDNDHWIKALAETHNTAVMAWGAHRPNLHEPRVIKVLGVLWATQKWCFGKTKDGSPRHPCRLPRATQLERFR